MTVLAPQAVLSQLSLKGLAIEYAALALALGLLLTRSNIALWGSVPVIGQHHYYQNFSNFSISLMLMVGIGLFPVLLKQYKIMGYAAAGIIIANIVMETSITILNTRDIADAFAGIAGVVFGLGFLALIARYGMKQGTNTPKN